MGTAGRLWIIGGLLSGLVLGAAAPALAHNQLIASDPADEANVEQGPDEVRLTFLASLDPDGAELAVTGPDGASAVAGGPDFDGADVTIPVDARLAGEYEVAYNVLSNDGHWADGTVTFTVTGGEPPEPSPTPAPESPSPGPSASPSPEPATVATSGTEDGGGLAWWAWLLIALVLAAAGSGGYLAYRRRGPA